jgi:hypothetical protein
MGDPADDVDPTGAGPLTGTLRQPPVSPPASEPALEGPTAAASDPQPVGRSWWAVAWATWRRPLAVAVGTTIVLRLVTEWVALVSQFGVQFPHLVARHPSLLVQVWAHWDTGYYLGIAQHGYTGAGAPANGIAFAPLYPTAIRLVHGLTGLGWMTSAELWSAGALVIGLAGLSHLASKLASRSAGDAAVVLVAVWPTAFFLLAAYPESTGLALVTWALLAAYYRRYLVAGLCAAGAALTKYYLVVVVVALVIEVVVDRVATPRGAHRSPRVLERAAGLPWRSLLAVIGPSMAAAVAWTLYQWQALGSPLAFAHAQNEGWGRHLAGPWVLVAHTASDLVHLRFLDTSTAAVTELFDTVTVVLLAVVAVWVYLRVRRSYGVLLALVFCVYVFEPRLLSDTREVLVLTPFFLGLGVFADRHPWRERLALVLFLPAAYFLIARFVTGAFAG